MKEQLSKKVFCKDRFPVMEGNYDTDLGRLSFLLICAGDFNVWSRGTSVRFPKYWYEPVNAKTENEIKLEEHLEKGSGIKQPVEQPKMVVYKYEWPALIHTPITLNLPYGAKVISFNIQLDGTPCIWACINPDQSEIKPRQFQILYTGQEVSVGNICDCNGDVHPIGTCIESGYVWHCFELIK